MKKIVFVLLLLFFVVTLSGCGVNKKQNEINNINNKEASFTDEQKDSQKLLEYVLTFQAIHDEIAGMQSDFYVKSQDQQLKKQFVVGNNDIPLMRYIGTKAINDIKISNLPSGINKLKEVDINNSFSSSARLIELAYNFLNDFYTKISELQSFEEFKIDVVDLQSSIDSNSQALDVFLQEYETYKNNNQDMDYSKTDGLYELMKKLKKD